MGRGVEAQVALRCHEYVTTQRLILQHCDCWLLLLLLLFISVVVVAVIISLAVMMMGVSVILTTLLSIISVSSSSNEHPDVTLHPCRHALLVQ